MALASSFGNSARSTSPTDLVTDDVVRTLVAVGYLPAEHRPMAELTAWSMMHGLAALLDGPLRELPADLQNQAVVRGMLTLGHGLRANGLTPAQETLLAREFEELGGAV
jgi:hypothetical protein